jgi:hypothetical protein
LHSAVSQSSTLPGAGEAKARGEFPRAAERMARRPHPGPLPSDGRGRIVVRLILAGVVLLAVVLPGRGATNFYTILTNGPAANRLNVTFLSEGYKTNELGTFLVDVTNALASLFAAPPFDEYRSNFNAFAIAVPSTNSGSDHPDWGQYTSTFFNSTFYGPLILIPPENPYDTTYSHGQGKVESLVATYMPATDLRILLVNDATAGGSGGTNSAGGRIAIVSTYFLTLMDYLPHEVGHALADLGDENDYEVLSSYPDTEEPNTTRETNRTAIKWKAWIEPDTPVPTPPTYDYSSVVGLFEGAHYHSTNWYRPQLNCWMRTVDYPVFCRVCSEALVLSIYRAARPIDSISPATNSLRFTNTQPQDFVVTPLHPATHRLRIQWHTNNVAAPGAPTELFPSCPRPSAWARTRFRRRCGTRPRWSAMTPAGS